MKNENCNSNSKWFCVFFVVHPQHGRSGFPKSKQLFYDEETSELRWEASKADASLLPLRRMSFNMLGSAKESSMGISTITAVKRGFASEVLVKAKGIDPSCSLCIESSVKTLSLVFETTGDRDRTVKALEKLMASEWEIPIPLKRNCSMLVQLPRYDIPHWRKYARLSVLFSNRMHLKNSWHIRGNKIYYIVLCAYFFIFYVLLI